jgi:hypothetical protein
LKLLGYRDTGFLGTISPENLEIVLVPGYHNPILGSFQLHMKSNKGYKEIQPNYNFCNKVKLSLFLPPLNSLLSG